MHNETRPATWRGPAAILGIWTLFGLLAVAGLAVTTGRPAQDGKLKDPARGAIDAILP